MFQAAASAVHVQPSDRPDPGNGGAAPSLIREHRIIFNVGIVELLVIVGLIAAVIGVIALAARIGTRPRDD